MPAPRDRAIESLRRILHGRSPEEIAATFRPRPPEQDPLPPRVPRTSAADADAVRARRELLSQRGIETTQLGGEAAPIRPEVLSGNIENFVGFARLPVGVIGPLRLNGTDASGDLYVPMATTEGALVASYHRGAQLVSQSGGVAALCLTEAVARAPCFVFDTFVDAGRFLLDVLSRWETLQSVVATTSGHCRLEDVKPSVIGKELYLILEFTTGDAAGQNMVTIATDAICRHLAETTPVRPRRWYVEANLSGDKKATALAFTSVRGKKTLAEAVLPRKLVRRYLHADARDLFEYWQRSLLGGVQSGSIGVQGHFANGLSAIFIACGQDVACIAEASVGLTRMDLTEVGDLYVAVALPNLIVGTVGGGTRLPTARECLEMMGCYGPGRARRFAAVCTAAVLAGEVSIIGSLAAGDFARAHAEYGRRPGTAPGDRSGSAPE